MTHNKLFKLSDILIFLIFIGSFVLTTFSLVNRMKEIENYKAKEKTLIKEYKDLNIKFLDCEKKNWQLNELLDGRTVILKLNKK